MPYFLERSLHGMSEREFFDEFEMDAITWTVPHKPKPGSGDYLDPLQGKLGFLESHRIANDSWRIFESDETKDDRKFHALPFCDSRRRADHDDRRPGLHRMGG